MKKKLRFLVAIFLFCKPMFCEANLSDIANLADWTAADIQDLIGEKFPAHEQSLLNDIEEAVIHSMHGASFDKTNPQHVIALFLAGHYSSIAFARDTEIYASKAAAQAAHQTDWAVAQANANDAQWRADNLDPPDQDEWNANWATTLMRCNTWNTEIENAARKAANMRAQHVVKLFGDQAPWFSAFLSIIKMLYTQTDRVYLGAFRFSYEDGNAIHELIEKRKEEVFLMPKDVAIDMVTNAILKLQLYSINEIVKTSYRLTTLINLASIANKISVNYQFSTTYNEYLRILNQHPATDLSGEQALALIAQNSWNQTKLANNDYLNYFSNIMTCEYQKPNRVKSARNENKIAVEDL
jgi:hypothetical protein